MKTSDSTIRKAAILVSSLDSATADALLAQMSPAQADAVRRGVMDLGDIARHEQEAVIGEFFRGQTTFHAARPSGVELDAGLARRLASSRDELKEFGFGAARNENPGSVGNTEPFQFLHDVDHDHLAGHLQDEHPQTIAVVLSHLTARRAADVVAALPADVQSEVLGRLADLDRADPEIVREVEQGLMKRMAGGLPARPASRGVSAVADILRASPSRSARQLLDNLRRDNDRVGRRLSRRELTFSDLAALEDETLREIFAAADVELAKLALVGADAGFADRILGLLPAARADAVTRAMRVLVPTPLSDLEGAQQAIAALAHDLEAAGRIDLPHTVQCV